MAVYFRACFALMLTALAEAAPQSPARTPLSAPARNGSVEVGSACDVGDNTIKLDTRSALIANAHWIVPFGSQLSLDPQYWEFRCTAVRDTPDGFEFEFQGGGANLSFVFDNTGRLKCGKNSNACKAETATSSYRRRNGSNFLGRLWSTNAGRPRGRTLYLSG